MAPTLLDAMSGNFGDSNSYLAEDPYYMGGMSIGQMQIRPQTSSEALWAPFVQGLAEGGFKGYGKARAYDTAYGDAQKNPLLQQMSQDPNQYLMGGEQGPLAQALATDYSQATRPEGWTPETAKGQLALTLMNREAMQKEEIEKEKQRADLIKVLIGKNATLDRAGNIVEAPILSDIEARAEAAKEQAKINAAVEQRQKMLPTFEEEQKIKGKLDPSGTKVNVGTGLGTEAVTSIVNQKAIADEARSVADVIEKSGISYTKLRASEMYSGLDDNQIAQQISNLADKVMRSRTGATAPPQEAANLKKIVAGDFSADPQMVAKLLRGFARSEASSAKSKIAAGRAMQEGTLEGELEEIIQGGAAATGSVPPGMKMQRNSKGETRLVPQ